jgi:hypothetical protein
MDEQAKINKDVVTKFEAMEKIFKNLDDKVTEVESSIREVFIMMKMLETQVGQLVGRPMGDKEEFPRQFQGPKMAKATQTHSGEIEDHTKETTKITTEGPEFEMPSHYTMESRLSQSLFTNFSFTWWNLGYLGAFSRISLSHDGISAISEPFHEFFFHMMEFSKARFGGRLFSYISQRIFT